MPVAIQSRSLTSLPKRLFKTGGRSIRHAQYYILQLADRHLTRRLFGQTLGRIERLAWHTTKVGCPDTGCEGGEERRSNRPDCLRTGWPGPTNSDTRAAHRPCVTRTTCVNVPGHGERPPDGIFRSPQRDDRGEEWVHIGNSG